VTPARLDHGVVLDPGICMVLGRDDAVFELREFDEYDIEAFAEAYAEPGLRLCVWRSPLAFETCAGLGAYFVSAWHDDDETRGLFKALGRPLGYALTCDDEIVDIGVVMVYDDGSAAISGFKTEAAGPARMWGVRTLARCAREHHGCERVMVADVPSPLFVSMLTGLPPKPPLKLSQAHRFRETLDALDELVPGVDAGPGNGHTVTIVVERPARAYEGPA
jgi:hypothetical protein